MVIKVLRWVLPSTAGGFTWTRIERSTDSTDGIGGTWTEFTIANDPTYTADGMPIAVAYARDLVGESSYWYRIRFYDKTNAKYSEYSPALQGSEYRGYCTVEDVRNYTNIQITEYDDFSIQTLIDTMTATIDVDVGRTWQGYMHVTNELLDSDGQEIQDLPHADIQTLSAISIDEEGEGTFVSVTPSKVFTYKSSGYIALKYDAEVTRFPIGRQRIKVSYIYGNSAPSEEVRMLCLLMVTGIMKMDITRIILIDDIKRKLRKQKLTTV